VAEIYKNVNLASLLRPTAPRVLWSRPQHLSRQARGLRVHCGELFGMHFSCQSVAMAGFRG